MENGSSDLRIEAISLLKGFKIDEIRGYIHELETRCDPAGEFRAWKAGEDAVLALVKENRALKKRVEELEQALENCPDDWMVGDINVIS